MKALVQQYFFLRSIPLVQSPPLWTLFTAEVRRPGIIPPVSRSINEVINRSQARLIR